MNVYCGVGFAELPVPQGSPMGGYADRVGGANGVADPLTVGAVTFFDGTRRAALVIADVICVNTDTVTAIRKALAHLDFVWVSATHTHCGPETGCVPGGGATPAPWLDELTLRASQAVERAIAAETPGSGPGPGGAGAGVGVGVGVGVGLGVGSAEVSGIAGVRTRGLATPVPVDVVSLPGAQLVVLPVHPTVLPASGNAVSADLPGAVRRELTRRTGLPTLVFTGAAGDISTRPVRQGQDTAELVRLAGLVADALPTPREVDTGPIRCSSRRIVLARKEMMPAAVRAAATEGAEAAAGEGAGAEAAEGGEAAAGAVGDLVAMAEAAYRAALASGDAMAARIAETRWQGARIAQSQSLRADDGPIEVEVGVLSIGGLTFVGLPGEPFLDVARRIRTRHPGAVVLGYTNGYPGYLPTRDAYAESESESGYESGYEVLASVVAPGSAETLALTATQLIEGS